LRSRDITDLVALCSVCQRWRSAFDIELQRRLCLLFQCQFFCYWFCRVFTGEQDWQWKWQRKVLL